MSVLANDLPAGAGHTKKDDAVKRYKLLAAAIVTMLSLAGSAAFAADSCVWSTQPDGSKWGTCVNDKGQTYCQSCPANGTACSVVTCK
jgi:hypothetical protein